MTFFDLDTDAQLERLREAAAASLRQWHDDEAELALIKYRENAVFRVAHRAMPSVLRVHRPGYHSDAALESELAWMAALADAGIAVPELLPAAGGARFVRQPVRGLETPVQIDRFAWIDGSQLGSVEGGVTDPAHVDSTYRTLGRLAAQVHNQSSAWRPPAGFTRHAWDAAGLAGPDPLWGRFWELDAASPAERALMRRARDRIHAELSGLTRDPSRYSLIHADFAPENVMVTANGVRLIDFDDAGFGWHLFELATALYFILHEPYYDAARTALIEGYREHRALPDEELERLPLFLLARGFTYVGWVRTRPGTETARELTPMLRDGACELAAAYLA